MKYAYITIQKVPLALVLVTEEEFQDEFVASPASLQAQLNCWVVVVPKGYNEVGHRLYAEYRAGLEDLGFSPVIFLAEILLHEELQWIELQEEEMPF
jgi:hypothetical protein